MKKIIFAIFLWILPLTVYAGNISWESTTHSYNDTYDIIIKANDTSANYFSGTLNITNGTITKISMSNGWINKTGGSNSFYFYHNGISSGSFVIATVTVKMTGHSTYYIGNPNYGTNKCTKDNYNILYNENGNVVDQNTYNNSYCSKSNDATLKSLEINNYSLNKIFNKNSTTYNTFVPNNISSVSFKAEPNHPKAIITSGLSCNLKGNITVCRIEVKAENGKTNTYFVNVYKNNDSNNTSNNDINNFKVHNGVLNKPFNINTNYYEVKVDDNTDYIYFEFDTPSNHYNQKCSSKADTCSFNVNVNNRKYSYTFKLNSNNNIATTNTNNTSSNNSYTTKKVKSATSNNSTKKNAKTNKDGSVSKQNEVTIEETNKNDEIINDEDKTINPIDNSKKRNKKEVKEEETTKEQENDSKKDVFQKNTFFVILAGVNLTLGIIIGRFIKRR